MITDAPTPPSNYFAGSNSGIGNNGSGDGVFCGAGCVGSGAVTGLSKGITVILLTGSPISAIVFLAHIVPL
jgi:hypothetical protein